MGTVVYKGWKIDILGPYGVDVFLNQLGPLMVCKAVVQIAVGNGCSKMYIHFFVFLSEHFIGQKKHFQVGF